jgi:ElaB/YqjD/DUF883 family membrane-anchored ribosome-binding protein
VLREELHKLVEKHERIMKKSAKKASKNKDPIVEEGYRDPIAEGRDKWITPWGEKGRFRL